MKTLFFFMVFLQVSCASIGEFAVNVTAVAIGNMLDRRVEDKLGNDAELSDEKLEPKMKKEKFDDCKNCEVDKWGRIVW